MGTPLSPKADQAGAGRGNQSIKKEIPVTSASRASAGLSSEHGVSQQLPAGHGAVKWGQILTYAARSKPRGNQLSLEVRRVLLC